MKYFYYVAGVFLFLLSFIGCGSYLDRSTHVLYKRPEWISAKSIIPMAVAFAQEFVFERETLANDSLNLSLWNSSGEVLWNVDPAWNQLDLNATLKFDAYLWIFLIKDENEKVGIRLSRNAKFRSGFFKIGQDKLFSEKEYFHATLNERNSVNLKYESGKLKLSINGKEFFSRSLDMPRRYLVFRSSLSKVILDDLMLKTDSQVISEDFSPRRQSINWIISFLSLSFLFGLTWLLRRREAGSHVEILLGQFFLTIMILGWAVIDRNVISPKYFHISHKNWNWNFSERPNNVFEVLRRRGLGLIYSVLGQDANFKVVAPKDYMTKLFIPENVSGRPDVFKKIYTPNGLQFNTPAERLKFSDTSGGIRFLDKIEDLAVVEKSDVRLAFMGGSQSFGGGASDLQTSLVSTLIRELQACTKLSVSGLNFSSPGDLSSYFVKQYKNILSVWHPTLLIIRYVVDEDLNEYRKNIEEIIKLSAEHQVSVLLINEAGSPEMKFDKFEGEYKIFRELAARYHLPLLEEAAYINSPEVFDLGLLWWDERHLDQAGHTLIARWLKEQIAEQHLVPCRNK